MAQELPSIGAVQNVQMGDSKKEKGVDGKSAPAKKMIYFQIQDKQEVAEFYKDTPTKEIRDLFRSAAGARQLDIVKLFNHQGHLLNISSHLESNTPDTRYTLQVVTFHVNEMLRNEIGVDLAELEDRIIELEKQLKYQDGVEVPPVVTELKSQVEKFRKKLETTEHLSWLGFYKELPSPLTTEACKKLQYRRKSDVQKRQIHSKFLAICDLSVSESAKQWLRLPTFDSSSWEDEEVILLLQHMFIELDLPAKFNIHLPTLRNFLYEVYKNYNEVPFHNFRHCFCVAQMMYAISWCVDIPNKMGDLDTLILLTSCICHDLDHPGYNNIYQINARTELALRYNDISPLENHHCSVAFRILENPDCNIFGSMDKDTFREVREGIIRCILATDMARHNEILAQFKDITPEFDFNNKTHRNLLSMVLIKVADISNEARPMNVAEPWLDKLLQEFFKQSDAEKLEGLPVTPFMDREKITKPSSQCSFIGFVLLPLFEALGELFPQLHEFIIDPVKDALEYYRRLNEQAKDERLHRKSVVEIVTSDSTENADSFSNDMVKSNSGHSVRSRRSLITIASSQGRQRSRSSEEIEMSPPSSQASYDGLIDDFEDGEEQETVTEVEVSEKTLKFKISTEGSVTSCSGRKSCPGSRKGSREKNQYIDNSYELSRIIKEEGDQRSLKRSTTSDTMESRKNSSDSTTENSRKGSGESERNEENMRRKKEERRKSSLKVDKYEYRRKSLAVAERIKVKDDQRRRRSISTGQEMKKTKKISQMTRHVEIVDVLPETARKSENRTSRDFETSSWGLQNLKKDSTSIDLISFNSLSKKKEAEEEKVQEEEVKETEDVEEEDKKLVQGSLFSKIKSFTDKFTGGSGGEESGPKSNEDNQIEDDKAMTLPKTKKPQKQTTTGKLGRSWKALIGINTKTQKSSSSLELLPPSGPHDSPSPVRLKTTATRRTSIEEIFERKQVQCNNSNNNNIFKKFNSSPKKGHFLLKLNKSDSSFEESSSKSKFLNTLTSSFRKRRNDLENESGGSTSPQENINSKNN